MAVNIMTTTLRTSASLLLSVLLWSSCGKSNLHLKAPTQLGIRFGLGADYLPPADGLTLDKGHFILSAFEIKGVRTEGEVFTFNRTFSNGLRVDFNAPNALEDLVFDIPMGTYRSLSVSFDLLEQPTQPSCEVVGQYEWAGPFSSIADVKVRWMRACHFETNLIAVGQERRLDASEQVPQLVFQPYAWFADTGPDKWNHADYRTDPEGRVMNVDANNNSNLFAVADDAIGQTITTQW